MAQSDLEDLLQLAIGVAKIAHAGQRRRGGEDYFTHPQWVAEEAREARGLRAAIIGYLHDTIEDTSVTFGSLLESGFPRDIVMDVDRLTRMDGEPYWDYIENIAEHASDDALAVKLADIIHNYPGATAPKQETYRWARERLQEEQESRRTAAWEKVAQEQRLVPVG